MKKLFILSVIIIFSSTSYAQTSHNHSDGREITFPNVPGYLVLKCDLHQHSVFSDGSVWPNIRVKEALIDGLDAISLTEHLEYLPHREDIPLPDRNRSYVLAQEQAEGHDLIVINGSEVTRSMPPGHINAIFMKDSNKLLEEDPMEVLREANKQGAFVFWNHPNWIRQAKDGVARLTDMHRQLIKEGVLNGIEVVNETTYSDEALQIALDNNLTIIGASDVHELIDWEFETAKGGHRPITLVFAKEKSEKGIKDALINGRTVVWFKNLLIGKDEFLKPLIKSSLLIKEVTYLERKSVALVTIQNLSDVEFIMKNLSNYTLHGNSDLLTINPNSSTTIRVKTLEVLNSFEMKFKILNAVNAPRSHPEIILKMNVKIE